MRPNKPTDELDLRRRAQERLRSRAPFPEAAPSEPDIHQLLHELQVHQIELEMQNEELRDARAKEEAATARSANLHDIAITEQRRFTDTLKANEERQRSILASMAEGVVVQAADGVIIDCNPSAEKILGLSRDQIMGRKSIDPCWQAAREDGGAFPGEEHPIMVTLRTGQACRDVVMGLNLPDGSRKWIEINTEPMFKGGENRPYAAVASFADITQRKLAEETLREGEARKLEAIGHLAGGIAHQFNNILAAMMLNLNLVQMSSPEGEARSLLGELAQLSRQAAELIKQLLALSRQSVMQLQPVDLAAAVSRQSSMLGRLLGENVTLELSCAGSLPPVNADQGLLERILIDLCLNAREALKTGGRVRLGLDEVEVDAERARAHAEAQPGRYVRLSVADTGCGMDERTMRNLFEPFFTTKEVGQGAGLGLAAVRGIVQQHRGWVEVESRVAKGTTVRVYLPACSQPVPAAPAPERRALAHGKGAILVAEDDATLRKATRMLFVRMGYAVLEAATGKEALDLWEARREEIDLLYTDMVMPGSLTGLQLAQTVLADKPGVKAIITSGYNADQVNLSRIAGSSLIYLPKPCDVAVLTTVVKQCLQRE